MSGNRSRRQAAPGVTAAVAACVLLFAGCAHRLEFPISTDVTPENRALLIERYDKGKVLFRANCSGCHGIFSAGRDSVPNFSTQQIDNYNANFVKADQRNHASAFRLFSQAAWN